MVHYLKERHLTSFTAKMCLKNSISLCKIVSVIILLLFTSSCQSDIIKLYKDMGIDLQKRSFVVVERKEQWCPNGDGELYARLSFSLASEENIKDFIMQMLSNGAKELPMTNFSYEYSTNLDQYSKSACQGYYLIKVDSTDSRNYCLITFDKIKKESAIQIEIY